MLPDNERAKPMKKKWLVTFERVEYASVEVEALAEEGAEEFAQDKINKTEDKNLDITCPDGWELTQTEEVDA